jgi:hypothetical protein
VADIFENFLTGFGNRKNESVPFFSSFTSVETAFIFRLSQSQNRPAFPLFFTNLGEQFPDFLRYMEEHVLLDN